MLELSTPEASPTYTSPVFVVSAFTISGAPICWSPRVSSIPACVTHFLPDNTDGDEVEDI